MATITRSGDVRIFFPPCIHGPFGGPRRRRSSALLIAVGFLAITGWSVAACGSDDSDSSDSDIDAIAATTITQPTLVASSSPTTPRDPDVSPSPDELADDIGALYLAVYDDVIASLADRPDAAAAKERLDTLKAGYIEQFVAFGRQREAMAGPDRATVDAGVSRALAGLAAETLADYQAAIDHYADDPELNELIRSFNIIGQYAAFDLLREQEPEEATRLGID
jgi:hypothetical protein